MVAIGPAGNLKALGAEVPKVRAAECTFCGPIQGRFQCFVLLIYGTCRNPLVGQQRVANTETTTDILASRKPTKTNTVPKQTRKQTTRNKKTIQMQQQTKTPIKPINLRESWRRAPIYFLKIWCFLMFLCFHTSHFPLFVVAVYHVSIRFLLLPQALKCTTATWLRPAEPNLRRVT